MGSRCRLTAADRDAPLAVQPQQLPLVSMPEGCLALRPHVIVLNVAGSVGKTSTARALQKITAETFLHVAMDAFLDMLPEAMLGHVDGTIFEAEQDQGQPSVAIRTGLVVDRAMRGMRHAIAASVIILSLQSTSVPKDGRPRPWAGAAHPSGVSIHFRPEGRKTSRTAARSRSSRCCNPLPSRRTEAQDRPDRPAPTPRCNPPPSRRTEDPGQTDTFTLPGKLQSTSIPKGRRPSGRRC